MEEQGKWTRHCPFIHQRAETKRVGGQPIEILCVCVCAVVCAVVCARSCVKNQGCPLHLQAWHATCVHVYPRTAHGRRKENVDLFPIPAHEDLPTSSHVHSLICGRARREKMGTMRRVARWMPSTSARLQCPSCRGNYTTGNL